MENPTNPKNSDFIEELKKASQEIEGTEELQPPSETKSSEGGDETKSQRPPATEISKETPTPEGPVPKEREGGGWVSSKEIFEDLENHLSEIVKERKRLEEDQRKIQKKLSQVLNLENRIRRFLEERKKINEDLGKWKQS